jgi:hypothetical protein
MYFVGATPPRYGARDGTVRLTVYEDAASHDIQKLLTVTLINRWAILLGRALQRTG